MYVFDANATCDLAASATALTLVAEGGVEYPFTLGSLPGTSADSGNGYFIN